MKDHVRVPQDRVGAVIGKSGRTLRRIEEETGVELSVDSENGVVEIDRSDADPVLGWKVSDVVKAIGRGFSPDKALELLEDDNVLEVIDISTFTNTSKGMRRLRGRVIGEDGRTRELIEELTETHVAVKGKTVAIIGEPRKLAVAADAAKKLLDGAPHSPVYRELEEWRREENRRKLLGE